MKTFVEFRSLKFPPYDREEHEMNPGLWGNRLAEYISQKLKERDIIIIDIIIEDWGCYLPIQNDNFRLALCCGHQYGDDDQFVIFTDPKTTKIRKFLQVIDTTQQLTKLTNAVKEILENDPDIHDIKWREP
ncbi:MULTISPECIES: hypothetical protein [Methylosinus]|uniref:hypothetical protein n=1 Tax=Methylosinus TaxID=425 RepID=UPI0012DC4F92|nr:MULTISPECIES: hypothetical protein [Methylosinus]